jgi:hypothetical protein
MKPNINYHKPNRKLPLVIIAAILAGLVVTSFYCLGSDVAKSEDRIEKLEQLIEIQGNINGHLIKALNEHEHKQINWRASK